MTEIVIDPEVPAAARRELEQTPLSALAGFNDPLPGPVSRPVSGPGAPVARYPRPGAQPGQRLAVCATLAVASGLLFAGASGRGPFSADLMFLALLIALPAAVVGGICLVRQVAGGSGRPGTWPRGRLEPATAYRRRYVVPELDLHGDELARWRRAAQAARSIQASESVRLGLADSAEMTAALPYQLWDVAERLALLSGPERREAAILRGLDVSDADIRAVLEPRRRVRERTVADIERRIRRLEEFAKLAQTSDTARKRNRAIEELAQLNPDYEELLIRLDDPDTGPPSLGQ